VPVLRDLPGKDCEADLAAIVDNGHSDDRLRVPVTGKEHRPWSTAARERAAAMIWPLPSWA